MLGIGIYARELLAAAALIAAIAYSDQVPAAQPRSVHSFRGGFVPPVLLQGATFTVKDAIRREVLLDTFNRAVDASGLDQQFALFSPDGSRSLIRTRRGDLAHNTIVETLRMLSTAETRRFLNGGQTSPPRTEVLAQLDAHDDADLPESFQWLSNSEIGYIANDSRGVRQAWALNVQTHRLVQLSHSATDVVGFAANGLRVIYYAKVRYEAGTPSPVAGLLADYLSDQGARSFTRPVSVFWEERKLTRTARQVHSVKVSPFALYWWHLKLWLSPDGTRAIGEYPVTDPPAAWADYEVGEVSSDPHVFRQAQQFRDPASHQTMNFPRFLKIELDTGTASPLLDAPSGFLAANGTMPSVWWMPDSKRVIVSDSYLPLQSATDVELIHRRSTPAIAEVNVETGAVTRIAWESPARGFGKKSAQSTTTWDEQSATLAYALTDQSLVTTTYYHRDHLDGWTETHPASVTPMTPSLSVFQTLKDHPKLVGWSDICRCRKVVFDPEPTAVRFSLGRVELLQWRSTAGHQWTGELIYPVGYLPGHRYPLIIQTHGSSPGEYLIDGPGGISTAMAAQPLANVGFLVMQVYEPPGTGDMAEAREMADGYKLGIELLVSKGLADPANVGLIAFSRTGLGVVRLLADYPDLLAAVDISDAGWWGYVEDHLIIPNSGVLATDYRNATSGLDHPLGLLDAHEHDPLYRLPNSRTAFRLEANGPISLVTEWELYSLLLQANRPVDYMYFPQGAHVLLMPAERMQSQGGTLDWFRFWLQSYEDPEPSKQDQYTRWRALRGRSDASLTAGSAH